MSSSKLTSNLILDKCNIIKLKDSTFEEKKIYYNYFGKQEYNKNDIYNIFVYTRDSEKIDANSTGKLYYRTNNISDTLIFSEIFINSELGNIYGTYIEENNSRNNYKHSYNYNIISSTGIYKNAKQMFMKKLDGEHKPREWTIN